PLEHRRDLARALARGQRRAVDLREQGPLSPERLAQRLTRFHAVPDIDQRLPEGLVLPALDQDVEARQDRKPGLDERHQLLVEQQELLHADAGAERRETAQRLGGPAGLPDRDEEQVLLLEL